MAFGKKKSYTLEEALRRMQRYCTYRDRCHKEVADTLRDMGMIPEAVDRIVVDLIEDGFLNEERFALEFTRGKFHQKYWGKGRIRRELEMREVSEYLIRKALGGIDPQEYQRTFDTLAERRWHALGTEKDINRKKRKLADYLFYRGWETSMVYDKIRELADGQD